MKINYEFYKDPDCVDIKGIAESLGIEHDNRGKYICPCHDDTHPSAIITSQGKHANRFKCFACGEGGDPLLLVMAVRDGIKPSEYHINPQKYWKERLNAARYIEKLYPGALIETKKEKRKGELPDIPINVLKEIGLKPNFMFQNRGDDCIYLTKTEMAEMICSHIDSRIEELDSLTEKLIFQDFVKISAEGRRHIVHTIAEQSETLEKIKKEFADYMKEYGEYPYEEYNLSEESEFIKHKNETVAKNLKALDDIYKEEPDFIKLPPNLLKKVCQKVDILSMRKKGYTIPDIAEAFTDALDMVSMDLVNYEKKTFTLIKGDEYSQEDQIYMKTVLKSQRDIITKYTRKMAACQQYLDSKEYEEEFILNNVTMDELPYAMNEEMTLD